LPGDYGSGLEERITGVMEYWSNEIMEYFQVEV
jgi:hypothetical protein